MIYLKPHDRNIMGDLFAYDRYKYQVKLCKIRSAPGLVTSTLDSRDMCWPLVDFFTGGGGEAAVPFKVP